MDHYKRIFIIGHPGSGKGVFAKVVAEKLGWKFIDADFGLEFHIGRTLTECLGDQGKEAVLNCELKILNHLLTKENIVVSTDGSIICNENIRQLLSSEFVVYLKVSLPIQLERISRIPEPLLDVSDLGDFLGRLHNERDELYEKTCKCAIDSDDSALEEYVSKIVSIINVYASEAENNLPTLDEKELILFHKTLHGPVRLSHQQALCIKLMAQGKSSKEIARMMGISFRTVEGHLAKAMEQLGCSSSKELIFLYFNK